MSRKPSANTQGRPPLIAEKLDREEALEALQRDLNGLSQLQQFQDRLLTEIRHRLTSLRNQQS